MWLIVLTSCVTTSPENKPPGPPAAAEAPAPDVKAPGNLPVMSEAELAEAESKRQTCIDDCVRDNQMRAVSPQEIRVDCEREGNEAHFVGQVEVSPAGVSE